MEILTESPFLLREGRMIKAEWICEMQSEIAWRMKVLVLALDLYLHARVADAASSRYRGKI